MVWNAQLLLVEKVDAARIVDALKLPAPGGRFVGLPSTGAAAAAGKVRGWGALVRPAAAPGATDAQLAALSKGARAFAFTLASARTLFAYAWWVDGKCVRKASYEAGEEVEAVGPQLRAERGIPLPDLGPDEDFVLTLLERLTGLTAEDLDDERYEVLGPA